MNTFVRFASALQAVVLLSVVHAEETRLHELGTSVNLDAKAPAANIQNAVPRPGHEQILGRVSIAPTPRSSPPSFFVTGRVISDNTGGGIERVSLFVGREDEAPRLAGMTNADGDFKFRLWITTDDRKSYPQVPPDFSGFLYVGGYPSLTHRNVLRLMQGYSVRYDLAAIAERSEIVVPVEAEGQ